ncbi:MAG: universal stress protein, partial [Desulfobacterales bacterium]
MKIMVCYTNSPASKDALREAQKHAKVWNASIEVVKVVERSQPIKRSRLQEMEAAFEHEIDLLLEAEESVY